MNPKKLRELFDVVLEYWARTIGAVLGLVALILLMAKQIDLDTFWTWIGAMVAVGYIPKFNKPNKDDNDAAR
jgi:hypothetical protein